MDFGSTFSHITQGAGAAARGIGRGGLKALEWGAYGITRGAKLYTDEIAQSLTGRNVSPLGSLGRYIASRLDADEVRPTNSDRSPFDDNKLEAVRIRLASVDDKMQTNVQLMSQLLGIAQQQGLEGGDGPSSSNFLSKVLGAAGAAATGTLASTAAYGFMSEDNETEESDDEEPTEPKIPEDKPVQAPAAEPAADTPSYRPIAHKESGDSEIKLDKYEIIARSIRFAADHLKINGQEVGQNAEGTDSWRGGPTVVGEKGPEKVRVAGISSIVGAAGPQIVNLPPGAQVVPNNRLSGIDRSQFEKEFADPQMRQHMKALAIAESGGDALGAQMIMETGVNRAQAYGKSLKETLTKGYYEPLRHDQKPYKEALGRLEREPELSKSLDGAIDKVQRGSNDSNYGLHNSSKHLAEAAKVTQTVTGATPGGDVISRKDRAEFAKDTVIDGKKYEGHGPGNVKKEAEWFDKTSKADAEWRSNNKQEQVATAQNFGGLREARPGELDELVRAGRQDQNAADNAAVSEWNSGSSWRNWAAWGSMRRTKNIIDERDNIDSLSTDHKTKDQWPRPEIQPNKLSSDAGLGDIERQYPVDTSLMSDGMRMYEENRQKQWDSFKPENTNTGLNNQGSYPTNREGQGAESLGPAPSERTTTDKDLAKMSDETADFAGAGGQ